MDFAKDFTPLDPVRVAGTGHPFHGLPGLRRVVRLHSGTGLGYPFVGTSLALLIPK